MACGVVKSNGESATLLNLPVGMYAAVVSNICSEGIYSWCPSTLSAFPDRLK